MFKYFGKISFNSNQELTPAQLNQLLDLIYLQLNEPETDEQEPETYETSNCLVTIEKGK